MNHPESLWPRRQFIKSAAVGGLALAVPAVLAGEAAAQQHLRLGTLDEAMRALDALGAGGEPVSFTTWNWAQTLVHCAQSIEYSMTGYPQSKSALFQNTVGAAAFAVFAWRGHMTHDLAEPIPGAPAIDALIDVVLAEARVRQAVVAFQQWQGELRPHFAYGELSKAEYAQAHAMHLANHLSFFTARASDVTS